MFNCTIQSGYGNCWGRGGQETNSVCGGGEDKKREIFKAEFFLHFFYIITTALAEIAFDIMGF